MRQHIRKRQRVTGISEIAHQIRSRHFSRRHADQMRADVVGRGPGPLGVCLALLGRHIEPVLSEYSAHVVDITGWVIPRQQVLPAWI